MNKPLSTKTDRQALDPKGYIVLISAFLIVLIFYFIPGLKKADLNQSGYLKIYYMGNLVSETAYFDGEEIYLPFSFIKDNIDPDITWDEQNEVVILTTSKAVYHLPVGKREGLLNLEPYSFTYPVLKYEGNIYLPATPLNKYYQLEIKHLSEQSIINIHNLKVPLQKGIILKNTKLRLKNTNISPWTNEVRKDQEVYIMKEKNGWYWVETNEGLMGYINEKHVKLTDIEEVEIERELYQPWNPLGEKILLTWEGVWGKTINPKKIGDITGVNVVSPTWFHLEKGGLVKNTADYRYIKWAQKTNRKVWGLFSNSFNPDLTHEVLSNAELRLKVIKQILTYVELYQLDGINLDFENMYYEDKEFFVQFVRELTPLLHELDKVVSIDVTFISNSKNWSLCYDRKSLGEIVDYMIVMAYDEHGTFSKKPGSVASLPWVEKGIEKILQQVPNEKILLGVPFYTRLWEEEVNNKGEKNLKSKVFSMEQAEKWIKKNNLKKMFDERTGQNYVELKKDGVTYKMWLEDELSLKKRIELMKKYHLAGVAAWRRGFEKEEVWPVVSNIINKR